MAAPASRHVRGSPLLTGGMHACFYCREINLIGKTAAQSSLWGSSKTFDAAKAINGIYTDVASTQTSKNPWWYVDLGSSQPVSSGAPPYWLVAVPDAHSVLGPLKLCWSLSMDVWNGKAPAPRVSKLVSATQAGTPLTSLYCCPPAAVAIYLATSDGYYSYFTTETLWITVGNSIPSPSSAGGDIKNTLVYSKALNLYGPGWHMSFTKTTGRYVAIQIRCAHCSTS